MNRFKIIALTVLATASLAGPALFAADTPSAPPSGPEGAASPTSEVGRRGGRHARQNEFKQLVKELDLSEDQKAKVKEILKARRSAIETLQKEERRGPKAKEIRESYRKEIRTLLTPEQQVKFDAYVEKMRSEHGNSKH